MELPLTRQWRMRERGAGMTEWGGACQEMCLMMPSRQGRDWNPFNSSEIGIHEGRKAEDMFEG